MKTYEEKVRLGNIQVTISNDNLEAHLKEVSEVKAMAARIGKNGDLRHRVGTDENDYFEVVYSSPEGRITQKIGKEQSGDKALFIAATEPLARYNRETDQNEVSFRFLTDDLRAAGFTDEGATNGNFTPAERVKQGKSWTFKPL